MIQHFPDLLQAVDGVSPGELRTLIGVEDFGRPKNYASRASTENLTSNAFENRHDSK